MSARRDIVLGVVAVSTAGLYYAEATRIQKSLLADAVGADGVPRMLAIAMGGVGLLLAAKGLLVAWSGRGDASLAPAGPPLRTHARAAGLLALLVGYLLLLPYLGYPLAIALLIAVAAAYGGARLSPVLLATAAGGAAFLFVLFRFLLGVPMPSGVLGWP